MKVLQKRRKQKLQGAARKEQGEYVSNIGAVHRRYAARKFPVDRLWGVPFYIVGIAVQNA